MTEVGEAKIPLPAFLKILTSNNLPVPRAMALAGKIYKACNTPSALAQLTDVRLIGLGVDGKEDRKLILGALRKAEHATARKRKGGDDGRTDAGPSNAGSVQILTTPRKKKLKRAEEPNALLPDAPLDEASYCGSLDFGEVLDEDVLVRKSTVVNRAPLMTAWAMVVAERMGFKREEALSIATVYTEMNAISKGTSLGIFEKGKGKGMEAAKGGAQPYVELMGRRPLYKAQSSQWRALSSSTPALPSTAFSYISRALSQTTPFVVGALRLLAASYGAQEVNEVGYGLYTEFRPSVEGWGKRGEVKCETILKLRKVGKEGDDDDEVGQIVKYEKVDDDVARANVKTEEVKEDRDIIASNSADLGI